MTADYIYSHDHAYNFLVYYFLPELSETEFRPDAAVRDERFSISQYMATLLLYEPNYNDIIQQIYDKEDAFTASSFIMFFLV